MFTNPNCLFRDHMSAPTGCCPLKFWHVLECGQSLLTHTQPGRGSPPTIFMKQNFKIGPNFNAWAPITLGPKKVTSRNFSTWRAARQAWEFGYNFLGACTPKTCESLNIRKIRRDFGQLQSWLRISPERIKLSTSRERRLSSTSLPRSGKRFGEFRFTNHKVQLSHLDPPKINSVRDFGKRWTSIANISWNDPDIDNQKKTLSTTISPAFDEKTMNFGPWTTKFSCLISTYPRSPVCARYRLTRLHSGHVTKCNFNPLNSPQPDLRPRAASH